MVNLENIPMDNSIDFIRFCNLCSVILPLN